MSRLFVAVALLAALVPAASARIAPPRPVPERVAVSDCIVVGTVSAVEERPVAGKKDSTEYHVAVVKIDDALLGAKGLTHIKVGFHPQGGGRNRFPHLNLQVGQEALFFLQPHPELDLWLTPLYYHVVDKKTNENYAKEVVVARRSVKLMADPKAALKSKDAAERLLAAGMLVLRHRTFRPSEDGSPKTAPIDAEESKLILTALAEADWSKNNTDLGVAPQMLFTRLNLTPDDGWVPPADATAFPDVAKKWLKDNADTYRIKAFVGPKK